MRTRNDIWVSSILQQRCNQPHISVFGCTTQQCTCPILYNSWYRATCNYVYFNLSNSQSSCNSYAWTFKSRMYTSSLLYNQHTVIKVVHKTFFMYVLLLWQLITPLVGKQCDCHCTQTYLYNNSTEGDAGASSYLFVAHQRIS